MSLSVFDAEDAGALVDTAVLADVFVVDD